MTFQDACNIAYPLSSAINNHLREEAAAEHHREEVNRYVRMYTEDRSGISTLRDEEPDLEDCIDKLIAEIVAHPINSCTVEQVKEFRLQVFRAASRVANRKIDEDIKQARVDAAVLAWELKQCED